MIAQTAAIEERIRRTQEEIQRLAPDVSAEDTLRAAALASSSQDGMETLGRFVARTQAQRTAAMDAGRRAYRESIGIEDTPDEDDTPETTAVRDPLTWRTREDGSVIPPSMESQQREQPQPILNPPGSDFRSREREIERRRRDLERSYETRLTQLRAEAPHLRRQVMLELPEPQNDTVEAELMAQRRRELERVRREGSERASLLQPSRRSVSNLRRYLRRQPAPALASPVNGLGDRGRSLSPENDNAWDTLLTTISPDPQPPSASSSFTSAAPSAAASAGDFSVRSQGGSSSTATSVDVDIDGMDTDGPRQFFENICETFESRGSESEEERETESAGVELRRAAETEITGVDEPTLDVFWRGYTEVVSRRAERVARHSGLRLGSDHPFGGMQRIVQRLATREDIPDEWWATAGLARIVAREEQ